MYCIQKFFLVKWTGLCCEIAIIIDARCCYLTFSYLLMVDLVTSQIYIGVLTCSREFFVLFKKILLQVQFLWNQTLFINCKIENSTRFTKKVASLWCVFMNFWSCKFNRGVLNDQHILYNYISFLPNSSMDNVQ